MSPIEHRFLRELDDRYRAWLTPAGRMVLWAVIASAVLLAGGVFIPLVIVFSFFVSLLLTAMLAGLWFRPKLAVSRSFPPPVSAGDVLSYRVHVKNEGKRPARLVEVSERHLPAELRPNAEPPPIVVLQPGEADTVVLRLSCPKRGAFELPALHASSSFPSTLWKWGRRKRLAERVLVYPKIIHLEGFEVPSARNYQPGGIAVASHVGDSTEFNGTREFRQGDRVRDIHWPSSARSGRLVVKEFQEEFFVRLALVIDIEETDDADAFERGLGIAAGIADVLARMDYIIEIFAAGREVHKLTAGRALAHVENILQLLACLEPGDSLDVSRLQAELIEQTTRLSAVILVFSVLDDKRRGLVDTLRSYGLATRVIVDGRVMDS